MTNGTQQTSLGYLPDHWKIEKIIKLGDGKRPSVKAGPFGSSLKKDFYVPAGYKIYGQEQVISGNPFFGDYYIDESKFASLRSCEVLPDDILISLVGTVGKILVIPENAEPGIINPRLLRLSFDKKRVHTNFAKYFLLGSQVQRLLSRYSQGGTMGVLNAGILNQLPFPLPPLDEQRKIAEILSTWDEAIQTIEKIIAALKKRKKGLMQRLLTSQVRFPGFTDEWKEVKLGDLLSINYGKSPKEIRDEKGKYSIIGTGGEVGKTNSPLCEKPVIVIGRKGSIDKPKLIEEPNWVIDTAYYCIPSDGVDIYWLYHYLFYKGFAKFNEGSTLPSLSRPTVESIKILIPEFSEQQKISTCFSEIDKQINLYERKKQVLQQQKQGLMQRLLTGQVRVSV